MSHCLNRGVRAEHGYRIMNERIKISLIAALMSADDVNGVQMNR
jgi:hypothetical protein